MEVEGEEEGESVALSAGPLGGWVVGCSVGQGDRCNARCCCSLYDCLCNRASPLDTFY